MASSSARHHDRAALSALCHRCTLSITVPLGTGRSKCHGAAQTPRSLHAPQVCRSHAVNRFSSLAPNRRPATTRSGRPGLPRHPCNPSRQRKDGDAGRSREVLEEYPSQWVARRPPRPLEQGERAGCPHSGARWMDVRVAWNGGWHRRPPPRDYSQPPVGWGRLDPCARAGKTRSTGSSSSDGPWKIGARH